MNFIKTIATIILLLVGSVACYAQKEQVAHVYEALSEGNADGITRYIDNTVEISINNSQSTYSKAQAEMILKDFFKKHPPGNCNIEKTGDDGDSNIYSIGKLNMQNAKCFYRVFIQMKPKDGHYVLTELRIDK